MQTSDRDLMLCASRKFAWQLLALAGILLLFFLAGHVILVAFAGVLVAAILRGFTSYLQKVRFISPRWSYAALLCLILLIASALVYFLGPRILQQAHEMAKTIPQSARSIKTYLESSQWGRDLIRVATQTVEQQRTARTLNYAAALGELVTEAIVALAIGLFLGAKPKFYRDGLLLLVPNAKRAPAASLFDDISGTLRSWLLGQMIPMSVLGIGSLIGLWILQIPLAFTLALFTAAMLFIPYAGAIIAYLATALVAFAKGPAALLDVTCLYLGIHAAEAYVITPLAQRHAVRLPAAITIFSQLLLWKLAGVLGVVVATPLAAICLVAVQKLYVKRNPRNNTAAPGSS